MIKIHLPKWWQLSLASIMMISGAIASGGNYASAQTIKPAVRVPTPTRQIHCPEGYRYNSLKKKCELVRRPTLPGSELGISSEPAAMPLPPQLIARLQQKYPQAIQKLEAEDSKALEKLKAGDPATLKKLQQIEPRTARILQPYLRQRIQAQPHLRQVPNRDRLRN